MFSQSVLEAALRKKGEAAGVEWVSGESKVVVAAAAVAAAAVGRN